MSECIQENQIFGLTFLEADCGDHQDTQLVSVNTFRSISCTVDWLVTVCLIISQ